MPKLQIIRRYDFKPVKSTVETQIIDKIRKLAISNSFNIKLCSEKKIKIIGSEKMMLITNCNNNTPLKLGIIKLNSLRNILSAKKRKKVNCKNELMIMLEENRYTKIEKY